MGAPPFLQPLIERGLRKKLEKLHKSHTFDMVIP